MQYAIMMDLFEYWKFWVWYTQQVNCTFMRIDENSPANYVWLCFAF